VDTFRQIAQIDPDAAPRASVQVIDTWRIAKDLNKAQEEAAAAGKKFPKDRMVKLTHASLLSDLGKTDEAAAELRTLLDGERDRETQLAIAQIYEKGKRFAEMGQALDAAEKLSESKQDKQTYCSCAAPCSREPNSTRPPRPNFAKCWRWTRTTRAR